MISYKIKMNNTEFFILLMVIFVINLVFVYFCSKFISRQLGISFIIVFLIGVFLPFIWYPMLFFAIIFRLLDGPRYKEEEPQPRRYME